MPRLFTGLWPFDSTQANRLSIQALELGYRGIDTAATYGNEDGIGEALQQVSVPRSELYITTKLPNDLWGREAVLSSIDSSLHKLKVSYVDLYLIHWPATSTEKRVATWKGLLELIEDGRVASIGVSNFTSTHLQELIDATGTTPVVNQIELHPMFQQKCLKKYHSNHGIITQAWSPLARGMALSDPIVNLIAQKYDKNPAQIILRWQLENGTVVVSRSESLTHQRENLNIFDFQLDTTDFMEIENLDANHRIGPDPHAV